jgi:hypothetical protein
MPRILSPAAQSEREMLRQLIACDPTGLTTLAIAVKSGQGQLLLGTLMTLDGERALLPAHAAGVLSHTVNTDSDFFGDDEAVAIYTRGRFSWPTIVRANPTLVFDEISIAGLKARGIDFEAMFSGTPEKWWSLPH